MSAVQFNGDFSEVESKYPSLSLWADGDNRVFFEEDGERRYLNNGDWVVLEGGSHLVKSTYSEPKAASAAPKSPTKTTPSNNEETEMRPAQGSATTDDRK